MKKMLYVHALSEIGILRQKLKITTFLNMQINDDLALLKLISFLSTFHMAVGISFGDSYV